ncbi:MAG: hypothetical protein WED10_11395 [Brumimicrobium sp.]
MRLAGTYHPIPYLLEQLERFIPGVQTVNAIWKDTNGVLTTEDGEIDNSDANSKVVVQKWRNKTSQHEWLDSFSPFYFQQTDNKQLSLNDESNLNILVFYFDSPYDNLKDLIAIHFPENIFLNSLNTTFNGLSAKEKMILSNLLSSILRSEHKRVLNEHTLLSRIEHNQKLQLDKLNQLEVNLKQSERLYTSALGVIVNDIVKSYEHELNKEISVNEDVIYLLAKERLTQDQINELLKDAIYVAYNLGVSQSQIEITASLIYFDKPNQSERTYDKKQVLDKVKLLLDRYEQAAEDAQINGLTINGKNVASLLTPSVTPPAITDAVKKNEKRIYYLFDRFPGNWKLIRSRLRPLSQIDQRVQRDMNKIG